MLIYYPKGNEPMSRPELNIQNAGQEKPEIGHRLRQYILINPASSNSKTPLAMAA
jgi:hypothetical protein